MDLHPQTHTRPPKYPTLADFDRRLLDTPPSPRRYLAPPLTACLLAALLSGCGEDVCQTEGAPVQPLYVSEADVLAVIRDEAERLGLPLADDGATTDPGEGGSLAVDLSGAERTVGFSYIDYGAEETFPAGGQDLESALTGLSVWETSGGLDLCVLDGLDENAESFDEEPLRDAFRDFVDWLRENGRL